MVQLQILSGKMAGNTHVVRRFPFCVGRATGCELVLSDAGVWDTHFILEFQKSEGFILRATKHTFVAVNEQPQTSVRLRNGDVISFGSAKLQFWLAAPRQRELRLREVAIWLLLLGITILQIILIIRLIK